MKKWLWKVYLLGSGLLAFSTPAFASDGFDVNKTLANIVIGVIAIVVPILAGLGAKALAHYIETSKTKLDDRALVMAVSWAKDHFGDGAGTDKLQGAIDMFMKATGGKYPREDAEKLVRATYQRVYGELKNVKN